MIQRRYNLMKKFIEKEEYVTPEMKVTVVDEDVITNSLIGDGEILDEIPIQ